MDTDFALEKINSIKINSTVILVNYVSSKVFDDPVWTSIWDQMQVQVKRHIGESLMMSIGLDFDSMF